MTPYYITLDKVALTDLHSAHFRKDARVDKPNGIEDVLSVKRPGQLGASFRTDGTQAIVQYLTLTTKTLFLTKAAYDKTAAVAYEREAKRAAFADQKVRLAAGEALLEGEVRVHWKSGKHKADPNAGAPLDASFAGRNHGLFSKKAAHTTTGPLPSVVAIDPGQKNIWCASYYDATKVDSRGEATKLLNLSRPQYNRETGVDGFRKWLVKAKKTSSRFTEAEAVMAEHSLKSVGIEGYESNLVVQRRQFEVLKYLYGSRTFAKRRFLLARRKQRFDTTFVNGAVRTFREAGGDDVVVAYGDGSFPTSMKGMVGGGSAHKRLMALLSKKMRVVLTSEYRTTKACPTCRNKDESMVQPKGNVVVTYRNGLQRRTRIHGLSQCSCCGTLWSRDYAASLNIARSFVSHFQTGDPAGYLSAAARSGPRCSKLLGVNTVV